MADLVVQVCEISEVRPHTNADKLELAIIGGWQSVVVKGQFKAGDLVVYFPPDTLLPLTWTEQFGVTAYCQKQPDGMMRIRKTRLRGEPSFGLIAPLDRDWLREYTEWTGHGSELGMDMADHFSAEKYEPPVLGQAGDMLEGTPAAFQNFTDIENLRNFPDILDGGEIVICTEKIHGTQVKAGVVEGEVYAGSKNHARKRPETPEEMTRNFYWFPYTIPGVRRLLDQWTATAAMETDLSAILYGETYGRVQSLRYGRTDLAFRCFGMCIRGEYLDYDSRAAICRDYDIPIVPEVYRGPYSLAKMIELADGPTLAEPVEQMREGIVIQPEHERTDPKTGRVIFKCVGTEYLMGKHADKDTTDR